MSPRHAVAGLVLVLLVAAAVFQLKYAVLGLERDLAALRASIEEERWRLQQRRADLAYLTRPDRLAAQAAQLGLRPARAHDIVALDSIGSRAQLARANAPLEVLLPNGEPGVLRVRPVAPVAGR